ncbi:3'(2'),5'-bisphosphate nucleotidase CysQ [Prochlorococcus marinus]|uniref:3'(2'),5'-bisphosphate nucleotidase CysQ n=1 Tax=Prochlorococcus marinus TaxID=1219 RepID=UPI001ADA3E20|nr:3'(2'),5'-bisphosphate nucleotidase CysQ [Prochlorococcus marinus CUG1415]MBW3044192.1 3'(2'),5'-bisphosphate nucleotidase CysQ [Prochlorococcus marinus str. MU1415]
MVNLPSGVDIKKLINDLRAFSWEASDILIYYAQILKDSNNKSNILKNDNIDDPVTLADLKVNEIIIQRINENYKNINWGILSEENVKSGNRCEDNDKDWMWVLDPLDGTKDFMQGTENYAMHLALNYKQKPYIGIVLIPEKDELWIAYEEKVWCERRNGLKILPNLSKKKSLPKMVLVTSKNHRNETLKNLIKRIKFNKVLIMGSIGCKIASIVRGESDIYICLSLPGQSSPKDWDFAAPQAILKAAGGDITKLNYEGLSFDSIERGNYNQDGIIIASNNRNYHKYICAEIEQIILKYDIYPI